MAKSSVREITYLQDFRQTQRGSHTSGSRGRGKEEERKRQRTEQKHAKSLDAARAFDLTSLCHQLASPLMTIAERARALARRSHADIVRARARAYTHHTFTRSRAPHVTHTSAGYARDRAYLSETETAS